MRRLALGLLIALLLVVASVPGCVTPRTEYLATEAAEPSVSIAIDNSSLNVVHVYVTDENGAFIRHAQVGPLSSAHLLISKADIHTGILVLTARTHDGEFKSDQMPISVYDFIDIYIDAQIKFSTVTGKHGWRA